MAKISWTHAMRNEEVLNKVKEGGGGGRNMYTEKDEGKTGLFTSCVGTVF
jgi:hypothetical protein